MARERGPASNPNIQGKLRNREKLQEDQRKEDLKAVMGIQAGRRFIYDLLFEKCGLMNVYNAQDSGIYRHEGKREVGQKLAGELQTELPELYLSMVDEHLRDAANEKKLRDAALLEKSED